MNKRLDILIVEDSEDDAFLLVRSLEREGFVIDFERVESEKEMRDVLGRRSWDAILADFNLPNFDGLAALWVYQEYDIDIPFIVVSGVVGEETAVAVMRAGAHDYIMKDNLARLAPAIQRELAEANVRRERRIALDELQQSEERYRAVVEDQTDFIVRWTPDYIRTFVNDSYCRYLGRTLDELIGQHILSSIHEQDQNEVIENLEKLSLQNPSVTSEQRALLPDGYVRWVQWTDHGIFNQDGELIEIQSVGRDIQDRKLAEEALRDSEERFRSLVEHSQVGIFILNDDFQFTYANDELSEILGSNKNEVVGSNLREYLGEKNLGLIEDWQRRWLQGDESPFRCEIKIISRDGQEKHVELISTVIREVTSRLQMIGQLLDITERVRAVREINAFTESLGRRAVQLQVAAEIARDATTARKLDILLNQAVTLIIERFGYYHAGIFFIEDSGEFAVLTAANGKVGRQMLEAGHKLDLKGKGIIVHVARTGKSRIAPDVGADEVHLKNPLLPETRSEMALPLMVGEQIIGVLDVQSRQEASFDEEDASILQTLADQLAIAIDNARLFDAAQSRARELAGLYDTALVTSSELETGALLERLYEQVQSLIAPDSFIVALCDMDQEELFVALAMEAGKSIKPFVGLRLSLDDGGLTGWVIRNRQTLMIDDVESDPLPAEPKRSPHDTPVTRSWLGVPLIARDRVVGAVSIQSFRPHAFKSRHRRFLESLAAQAAIALENARLFAAERSAREQAETLRDVTQAVSGSLDVDEVLRLILEQLKRVIFFDTASVYLRGEGESSALVAGIGYEDEESTSRAAGDLLRESPILAQMSRDLKPVIIPDVHQHPGWIWVPGAEHVESFLAVPIIVRQQMTGALMVDSVQREAFAEKDAQTLVAFAQHMAIAVDTARLFEAERAQLLLSRTLQEIGMLLTSEMGMEEVLEQILDLLHRVVQFDSASIQMIDADQSLYLAAGRGLPDFERARLAIQEHGEQMLSKRLKTLQVDVLPDTSAAPSWIVVPGFEYIRSWVGAPLLVRGTLIGVLNIDSQTPGAYDQETGETVMAFASQAAIVIENARLFDAERAARERAEVLREATQVIASTLSLDQVIEALLEQLARILPYATSSLMLIDGDQAYIRAGRGYEKYADPELLRTITFDVETTPTIKAVVQGKKPASIPDTNQDPAWKDTPVSGHVRSWLGVPLQVRDQVIGLFSLDRTEARDFSDEEVALAQIFAAHTSAAIENARLFETEEKRVEELEILRQVSLSLTASLEPEAVLDAILDGVFRLIPEAEDAHIFLYEKGHLIFGAALWRDGRRGTPWAEPRDDGLTYNVVRNKEIIVVPDMGSHPLFDSVGGPDGWKGAIVGLPLKIGERVVGVMNVAFTQPRVFPEAELRILSLLGDQAALAVENARLFEQTKTERRHLSLLYAVGQAVAASLEPDAILESAIELTCRALGGAVASAWLFTPEDRRLYMRALYGLDISSVSDRSISFGLPLGEGLLGWVAENQTSVNVPDIIADERWIEVPYLDKIVRSSIVSPILEAQNLLGVMAVLHHQPSVFTDDHLDLLQAICQQVGLALSNARRYQDINRLVNMLEAEQNRLVNLIERLPVGILLLDDNHCLLVANLVGREILGYLSNADIGDVITYLGSYTLSDIVARHADPIPVEIVLDGSPERYFEAQARPIGGESRQWVVTLREVTQEREIQDRIQMQDRLATVGQLAAGIAHDFNNIMASIVVYADLLMIEPGLPVESRERVVTIQQQVQRAASLIRQILDFSRRSVMEQSPLDLLPFFKEIEKLLRRTLPETIQVKLEYESGEYLISADPTRIQQVFMNLAVNARDAMPDGGRLDFKMGHLHLNLDDIPPTPDMSPGDWVRVTVSDTGMGIPSEDLSHVFEPFFTTKPVGEGTGLGLAQVYGIIRQHGGHIDVHSQVGKGTTFTIYLPRLVDREGEFAPPEITTRLDGRGQTVLVVEDDAGTRMALQTLLDVHNYRVLLASNGAEALDHMDREGERVVLVISDIVMPEMGGMELYDMIQSRWPQSQMLFITGHPMDQINKEMLETGELHWLQKPFSVQEFSEMVQVLLGK
jgi:PAS domain S-box-containing protein